MSEIVDLMWKRTKLAGFWASYVFVPLHQTHDCDLDFSGPNLEIALSQELEGLLTWDEMDVQHILQKYSLHQVHISELMDSLFVD